MTTEFAIQTREETGLPGVTSDVLSSLRHLLSEVQAHGLSDLKDAALEFTASHPLATLFDLKRPNLNSALALLGRANTMIERAEETILHQEQRIAHLESLATTDELTGLKNRRGFYESFHKELDRCERGLIEGGLLVLIDLDNFKAINDTYGHAAGDACLKLVAKTLDGEIRIMDAAARLGGDEFVLLLSNTSKREAAGRAQSIGQRLNNLSLAWQGDIIPIRASLGLKGYHKGESAESIFHGADSEMYASKRDRSRRKSEVA